jgi:hypothetical protein
MRRSASEVIRNLEKRIARLEKSSGRSQGSAIIEKVRRYLLDYEIPVFQEGEEGEEYIKRAMGANIRRLERELITLILGKIETQLNHIEAKTKKERLILNLLAPNHFTFNYEGSMYQEIKNQGHDVWQNHELFIVLERFKDRVGTGRYLHRLEELTNHFLDEAVKACREIGI